jgi:hypothetical protein
VLKRIAGKLTYANVVASLALFLALSGGVVWASGKIGANKLRANSVTTGKIKRNAITGGKIRANAITAAKIKAGSVDFTKLAAGTGLIGTASGGPVPANQEAPITVPLSGTVSFTPSAGVADLLSVEARGDNLARTGATACEPQIVPFVNGSKWDIAEGTLRVRAFEPTADRPTGLQPISGGTGPVGLTSPGVAQTVSVKVYGDTNCAAASTVSVGLAITQAK